MRASREAGLSVIYISHNSDEVGDLIRTVTFAPVLPGSVWLTEQLSRRGIVPVPGQTEATYEQADRVIRRRAARHAHVRHDPRIQGEPRRGPGDDAGHEDRCPFERRGEHRAHRLPVHVPRPFSASSTR